MGAKEYLLLVVDDDEDSRDIVSRRLARAGYNVSTAASGIEALGALERQAVDLVLLDIMMPEMDGYQVLERMKSDAMLNRIPVLMLTAVNDRDGVLRCLRLGAKDYIVKPFDIHALRSRIEKCLADRRRSAAPTNTVADDAVSRAEAHPTPSTPSAEETEAQRRRLLHEIRTCLQTGNLQFPVLPTVAFKVAEVAQNDQTSLSELANIIQTDAGLASKLISISNSSHYRGVSPFETVEDAVLRIGQKTTASYVLSLTTSGMFNVEVPLFEKTLSGLWEHSLATGICAKTVAKHTGHSDPDLLFTMGLLHDIGKLLIVRVLMKLSASSPPYTEELINEVLESQHMKFGAALLRKWRFPQEYIDVALYHHEDFQMDKHSTAILIVAFSDLLVHRSGMKLQHEDEIDLSKTPHAMLLGLTDGGIKIIASEAYDQLQEMNKLF